jgi:hypothetical protein
VIQFGLDLLHLTTGTRLVTAIRSSLTGRLQIPRAPAWVGSPSARCPKFAAWVGSLAVVTTHRERSGDQAGLTYKPFRKLRTRSTPEGSLRKDRLTG